MLVELVDVPKPLTIPPPAQNSPGTTVPPPSERGERNSLYDFRTPLSHACFVLIGVSLPSLFLVGPEIGNGLLAMRSLLLPLAGQAKANTSLSNPVVPSSVWEIGMNWEEDQCYGVDGKEKGPQVPLCSSASPGQCPGGKEGWWPLGRSCSTTASPASPIHCFSLLMGGRAMCLIKPSHCQQKPLTYLLGMVTFWKVASHGGFRRKWLLLHPG